MSKSVGTFVPQDSNVYDNLTVDDVLFWGLVRYDIKTGDPYNYMAESIESEDNTTWTIKIKEGWKFHNGEPVDAEAYARAWNVAAYGTNAMANNYFFDMFAGYDEMQGEYEEHDEGKVTVIKEPEATTLSASTSSTTTPSRSRPMAPSRASRRSSATPASSRWPRSARIT